MKRRLDRRNLRMVQIRADLRRMIRTSCPTSYLCKQYRTDCYASTLPRVQRPDFQQEPRRGYPVVRSRRYSRPQGRYDYSLLRIVALIWNGWRIRTKLP